MRSSFSNRGRERRGDVRRAVAVVCLLFLAQLAVVHTHADERFEHDTASVVERETAQSDAPACPVCALTQTSLESPRAATFTQSVGVDGARLPHDPTPLPSDVLESSGPSRAPPAIR